MKPFHAPRRWLCLMALLLATSAQAQSNLPDTDKDGIPDAMDNCTLVANPDQADFDNDGFGNVCDADVNNDGIVNAIDISILRNNFGKQGALGDLNGDGIVNALDVNLARRNFGQRPGPTAILPFTPTSDGRAVPVASQVELLQLTPAAPDGRNALVLMNFAEFFSSDSKGKKPAIIAINGDGDVEVLRKQKVRAKDLGKPNALGRAAGERVVLNDLGLFGDEKANDGIYSGLARINPSQMDSDAKLYLSRLAKADAKRTLAFDGRQIAREGVFDPQSAFEKVSSDRELKIIFPNTGAVSFLGRPIPPLVTLLPPSTDPKRTLMVTNLGVVQDPTRTFSPCNNAGQMVPFGNVNGAWSFKTLMSNMANTPVTGISAQTFINDWLKHWMGTSTNVKHSDGVPVPSFPIPPRTTLLQVIQTMQPNWNPNNPGTLDINKLPFRLLAIVNRLDLAKSGYLGTGGPGELRFVFGLLETTASGQCFASQEMTVILEYKVPTTNCQGLKLLANEWIALNALLPGSAAYNAQLQALTDDVTLPNAFQGRPNGSAIGQVRTNEVRLRLPWELREFTLQASPVHGKLMPETVKNTPDASHNRTALLTDWITNHHRQEVPRQFGGVDFIGTANRYGLGVPHPSAPTDKPNPPWEGDVVTDVIKRFDFSSNTCGGCHLSETGTSFTMVKAGGGLGTEAALAGFLTGITVADPVHSGISHHFDDLHRRGVQLDQIAANSCFFLPRLRQDPGLILPERPRLPESVFAPRFAH
ncbi:MAG: hypothetical protein RJB60_181 [Pseudomonadota bacterium]|jgi:hypothetical protein